MGEQDRGRATGRRSFAEALVDTDIPARNSRSPYCELHSDHPLPVEPRASPPPGVCSTQPLGVGGSLQQGMPQYFQLDQNLSEKLLERVEALVAPRSFDTSKARILPNAITKQIDKLGDSFKSNLMELQRSCML